MKIAMIGYGRLGKEIKQIAEGLNHEVITIDPSANADFKEINEESTNNIDVAIDFSLPTSALQNAKTLNSLGINTVMGTTGWYNQMDDMRESVKDIGFIWSGNFSLGVNIFFRIIENASKIINNVDVYDVLAHELHHSGKRDSPSGTANMIGDILLKNIERKNKLTTEMLDRKIEPDEIHFASVRGGSIPGTHSVMFDSQADTIELKHTARGIVGFATGAVLAAEWIKDKKGFYNIDDFMNELIGGK